MTEKQASLSEKQPKFAAVTMIDPDTDATTAVVPEIIEIDGVSYYTSSDRRVKIHAREDNLTEVTVTFIASALTIRHATN